MGAFTTASYEAAGVSRAVAAGRKIVIHGDSLSGQAYTAEFPANCDPTSFDTTITARQTRSRGVLPLLNAMMGQPFVPVYYGAVTGTTTQTILATLDNVLARAFDGVQENGGTNNISLFATLYGGDIIACENGIVADRIAIWKKDIEAGAKFIIALAIPPVGATAAWTDAQKTCAIRANRRLARYAQSDPRIRWIDIHEALVDPTTGLAKAGALWDTDKHWGSYGNYLVCTKILQDKVIAGMAVQRHMVSSKLDCIQLDTNSKNLLHTDIGLGLGATGAAGGAGSSGTVLTGLSVNRDVGLPDTVCSVPAAPNGIGNCQKLVITSNAANNRVRCLILPGSTIAQMVPGTWYRGVLLCKVTSATNLLAVTPNVKGTWVGGSLPSQSAAGLGFPNNGELGSCFTNNEILTLMTEPFYVPLNISSFTFNQLEVYATFSDIGGATLELFQMEFERVQNAYS